LKYLKENHIKRVIDAGIDAIYLEEPNFGHELDIAMLSKKNGKTFIISIGDHKMHLLKTPIFPIN
jgi:hypothetical protein